MRYLLMLIIFVVGCLMPIQASVNAKLGSYLKAPLLAALVNFAVGGTILLFVFLGTRTQNNLLQTIKEAPFHSWIGGAIGAIYVTSIIFLIPRLGAALSFGLILAGQLLFSMVIDHFGLFGIPVQTINWGKVFGVALILTGVLLIQKY